MHGHAKRFSLSLLVQFLMLFAILRPGDLDGYEGFLPSNYLPGLVVDILAVTWWYALAWNVVSGLELFVWQPLFGGGGHGPRQRKLLTDMCGILIYFGATVIIFVHVFKQPIAGVFATSGIIAIVIGLALQNTLGDLFAGLALNIERPYRAGDWITLDNGSIGMVLLTNWRSTHIRTPMGDELIVPNSLIARARMTNHTMHDRAHRVSVDVPLAYGFEVPTVAAMLSSAAASVDGVLTDPPPNPVIEELRATHVVWRIYFHVHDFAQVNPLKYKVAAAAYTSLRASSLASFLPGEDAIKLA